MKEINQNAKPTKPRQQYDETYKRHAVELSLTTTRTIKAVAQELGVTKSMLYRWRELYAPRPSSGGGGEGPRTLEQAEGDIRQLRAEVIRMRERESVLKKSLGILSETPERGMPRLKR
jgi:transposase